MIAVPAHDAQERAIKIGRHFGGVQHAPRRSRLLGNHHAKLIAKIQLTSRTRKRMEADHIEAHRLSAENVAPELRKILARVNFDGRGPEAMCASQEDAAAI